MARGIAVRRNLYTTIFVLATTVTALAQAQPRYEQPRRHSPPSAPTLAPYSPSPRGLYQRNMPWYEFMLHQLNPHDRDYGAWYRERRESLVDASIRNQYFWYACWATMALIFVVAWLIKSLYDRRKEKRIMDEMMEEVKAHDTNSRKVAHEAIQRYNEHIELCNRAIEASEAGKSTSNGAESRPAQAQTEVDKLREQKVRLERDNARMAAEVQQRQAAIPEYSKRIEALSKAAGADGNGQPSPDASAITDPEAVRLINELRQQLCYERDQNKRLKGGR